MTWSEAFTAYLKRHNIRPADAALVLGVSIGTVYYWRRGSEPRGPEGLKTKRKVEAWSRGEIPAAPWTTPAKAAESGSDVTEAARAAS